VAIEVTAQISEVCWIRKRQYNAFDHGQGWLIRQAGL
jgi:hypothetical protein